MTAAHPFDGTPQLIFTFAVEDASIIVGVVGEIDMGTAPEFERQLASQITGYVRLLVVDLSEVSFLASSGLNALVAVRTSCRAGGVALRLVVGHNRPVMRILAITGLDKTFAIYEEKRDAVLDREEPREGR